MIEAGGGTGRIPHPAPFKREVIRHRPLTKGWWPSVSREGAGPNMGRVVGVGTKMQPAIGNTQSNQAARGSCGPNLAYGTCSWASFLDRDGELTDICHMANAAKPKTAAKSRSARAGQFVGRTKDGLLIPRPAFRPKSFTLRQLDDAVKTVKRRQAATAG